MITAILVLWIPFGLFSFFVMKRVDEAAGDNPSFGVYWVKHRERRTFLISLFGGFLCLPFTLLAAYDWLR